MRETHDSRALRQCHRDARVRSPRLFALVTAALLTSCTTTPTGPFTAANKPVITSTEHAIAVLELTTEHPDRDELTHHLRNELIRVSGVDAADTLDLKAEVRACEATAKSASDADAIAASEADTKDNPCGDIARQFFARERVVSATLDAIGGGYSTSTTLRIRTTVKARVAGHGKTPARALSDAAEKLRPHLNTTAPPSTID